MGCITMSHNTINTNQSDAGSSQMSVFDSVITDLTRVHLAILIPQAIETAQLPVASCWDEFPIIVT